MLQAVLQKLDEIPEALRSEYQEAPDPADKAKKVFVLDLDDSVRTHPKVIPLSTAVTRMKADLAEKNAAIAAANEKLKIIPEDFDPAAYAALVEDSKNKGAKIDERVAAVRAEEAKKAQTAMEPLNARIVALETAIKDKAAGEAITAGLTAANIAPEFMEAARALITSKYKIKTDEIKPGEYTITIDTEAGPSDAKAFVKEWAGSDEGKPFVNKAKGGGALGGSGGETRGGNGSDNPFAKGHVNMTAQQDLIIKNPLHARQLAIAAGVKPYW